MGAKLRGGARKKRGGKISAALPIPSLKREYETRCKELILWALDRYGGSKAAAAELLGVNRTTLVQWLKLHAPEHVKKQVVAAEIGEANAPGL